METKIKSIKLSLFQTLQIAGSDGCDICDDIYDWGTYLGCPESWEKCTDYYDRCMLLFALNLRCDKYNESGYSVCHVTEFLWENREPFERFMNEENRRDYTPRYWQKQGETIDPKEDGLFYDVYMTTFESLLIGNYSEPDYQKLYKYLTEWDKWSKINKGNFAESKAFVDSCLNDIEVQIEDGEQYLITRYNFSEDKNSLMNLDNLNSLYDNIFTKEDYIVVRLGIYYKWQLKDEELDEAEIRRLAFIERAEVTNNAGECVSLSCVLKEKGLLKAIFNNTRVIETIRASQYAADYERFFQAFKAKEVE